VTVGPLAADLYGYSFVIDGFSTLDPGNSAAKPSRSLRTSILEIPGSPPRLHEFQDVPHGTVRIHEYRSRALNRRRGLNVYTPPGYEQDPAVRYPVLYLLHGAGDNEATWSVFGHAHLILDNLLAQRKITPMIVVMPDGHAASFGPPPAAAPGRVAGTASGQPPGDGSSRPAGPAGRGSGGPGAGMARNVEAFERDLLGDIIPFVEGNYRVRPEPASRAIAGLSMGGGQALAIGLNHVDRFGWVGGFSSAVFNPETALGSALKDPKATDAALAVIWIACGKNDFLIENNKQLDSLLREKSIHHEFLITEGNHSWPVWRRYLAEFAPLLFVEKP
jgi:enterochelin esterase family protein